MSHKGKEINKNITFFENLILNLETQVLKGKLIKLVIKKAYERGLISEEEIKKLQDPEYSKRIFNANYEVLRFKTKSIEDHNKRNIYYKKELYCNSFYLSSQWFEYQWENLLKWLKQIGYKL